jgi:hypothetical protein
MDSHLQKLRDAYDASKAACLLDWSGAPASAALQHFVTLSLCFPRGPSRVRRAA